MKTCMLHHNWDWSNGAKKKITVTMHLKELLQYRPYKCKFVVFLANKYDLNAVALKVFIAPFAQQ